MAQYVLLLHDRRGGDLSPMSPDEIQSVIQEYGAWGKKMFGKEGILRKTFIINPSGQVVKVYGRVTPLGHGEQVIEELKRLQASGE